MSSQAPTSVSRPRGPRIGLISVMLLLAFLAGAVVAGWGLQSGLRFGRWSRLNQQAVTARDDRSAAFTPAQPLTSTGGVPAIDPATLETREAALAGRLSALESRAATVATDAAAAGAQAARAESLMVAFAARRAVDRGTRLGYLEEQLRTRFGQAQPQAVGVVIQAARNPVTLEDLRQGLDALAPALQSGSTDDWWANLRRELSNLVVLRREGTASSSPTDRLAHAQRLLDNGRIDAARTEVTRLPGAAAARSWQVAARRYMLTHQALDVLETAAILGQAQGLQPPPRNVDTLPAPITESAAIS